VQPDTYAATLEVLDAVRRAKAERNLSMKAPVESITVTAAAATLEAIRPCLTDICGMLQVMATNLVEGAPETGLTAVEVKIAEA
jgi:valyl-tRNA synthetase